MGRYLHLRFMIFDYSKSEYMPKTSIDWNCFHGQVFHEAIDSEFYSTATSLLVLVIFWIIICHDSHLCFLHYLRRSGQSIFRDEDRDKDRTDSQYCFKWLKLQDSLSAPQLLGAPIWMPCRMSMMPWDWNVIWHQLDRQHLSLHL